MQSTLDAHVYVAPPSILLRFELEEPKMELLSSVLVYDIYTPILVAKSLIAAGFLAYLSEYE